MQITSFFNWFWLCMSCLVKSSFWKKHLTSFEPRKRFIAKYTCTSKSGITPIYLDFKTGHCVDEWIYSSRPVLSYKLRYIVGFWLVEMVISTNQKPTIYRNMYENTGPASSCLIGNRGDMASLHDGLVGVIGWLQGSLIRTDPDTELSEGQEQCPWRLSAVYSWITLS